MAEPWELYQQQAAPPAAPPPAAPTDSTQPAQTPASNVEPWQLYQQQSAPASPQPAAPSTPTQPQDDSSIPSLSDVVHNYIQGVKQRVGSTPAEFGHNVVTRLSDLNQGLAQHVDRSMLTIERAARAVDQAHGLFPTGHPLDAQIAHDESVVNAPRPTDPERAGSQQLGDDAGSVIEYMLGEGALKSLGVMDRIEALAPISKVIRKNPMVAKVLRTMIEQGTVGASQAGLQGGTLPDALIAGGESAVAGGLADAPQARVEARAAAASELAPTEMNVRGVPATILASELPGATPEQTRAATIGETPALREARQQAWQQLPVNLAKDAVTNSLTATNDASVADLRQRLRDTDDPALEDQLTKQINDIQAGGAGVPAWSYITPEGTSLSPAETRSAMNNLREHWLSQDWTPDEDQAIQDRFNDMKDQLGRYDSLQGTQPVGPIYNVADAVNNTSSFADAANHLRIVGDRALAEMPQRFRNDYTNLADQRAKLQDQFDANAGVPKLQAPIENEIARINGRMNDVLQEPDVMDAISQPRAEQALKDKRLSDAFQALHNVMTKHVTLTPAESADLGTPSEARGSTQSLVNDIRAIQNQYGDVLNPAIGDRGLNHILDLGQYMDMPEGRDRVQSLLGNMMMVLRRHFQGLRGMTSSGSATVGAYTLAHLLGHVTGATSLGIGALAGEAQAARTRYRLATDPVFNRMIRDRLSTDPAFANRFLFGARSVPPRHAAPLLGAMLTTSLNNKDNADAASQ
jgi:hypothetical protein